MKLRLGLLTLFGGVALALWPARQAHPYEDAPRPIRFERDIQPILARCVQCHGPAQARSGLRLDSRAAALAALDSGAHAVVPRQTEQSELLRRVASDAAKRMPPRGEPLPSGQIELLRSWISQGAEWPEHWAYRPLTKPAVPRLDSRSWAITPIDHFVLAKLTEHGLAPSAMADRRTLLRRLSFDLIGLPPIPEEVELVLRDQSPDWYEKVVDRLLASPHYGERWARHWMDIVHFAETHGHDQDRPREHAWPYRDYLIRAFNEDRPYTQFIQEQIAADVLASADPGSIPATGFLAAGPWDESSLRDIREDSLDRELGRYLDRDDIVGTVMATFVSSTVHCARCHDHKFDPISQAEYYSLQAVFAGIDKATREYDANAEVAVRRRHLTERKAVVANQRLHFAPELLDPGLQAQVTAWEKTNPVGTAWQLLEPSELKSAQGATLVRQADGSVLSQGKRPDTDVYTFVTRTKLERFTGLRLELLTDDSLPHKGPGRQDNGNLHLNEIVVTTGGQPLAWKSAEADFNQEGWTVAHAIDNKPETAWGIYPMVGKPHQAVFTLKEAHPGNLPLTISLNQTHGRGHLIGKFRLWVTNASNPGKTLLPSAIVAILAIPSAERGDRQRADLAAYYQEQELDRQLAALPPPQKVYCGTHKFTADGTFRPAATPRAVHVLQRGDIRKPGPAAQPGALACVPALPHRFALAVEAYEGERRAALARWLSDARNGLTWRSIANRIWHFHFGRGLVDTPNDFGLMGSAPTHPELLDWLAVYLLENAGSLKQLHRLIVTSAVYRQAVQHEPRSAALDADNRYLWRMNRHRLDAESIHDAVLRISGKLDTQMGGPSVKQFIQSPGIHITPNVDYARFSVDDPANYRRSVYRFHFRTLPDPFYEALDCPDGSQLTPVRGASITAVQALALWNDKFMVRQCEHIAERVSQIADPQQLVERIYWLILSRSPTAKESAAIRAYAAKHGLANTCRLLLNSNEFVFVD
jgi:hypothetical protein